MNKEWHKTSIKKKGSYGSRDSGAVPFKKQFSSGSYKGDHRSYGYKQNNYQKPRSKDEYSSNKSDYDSLSIQSMSDFWKVMLDCESKPEINKKSL
jgi:hypothetical protein